MSDAPNPPELDEVLAALRHLLRTAEIAMQYAGVSRADWRETIAEAKRILNHAGGA